MSALRCLFVVQGEGRGHLTQALALRTLLRQAGHTVAAVVVGQNEQRVLPDFFRDAVAAPVHQVPSPSFVADVARRGVRRAATLWNGLRHAARLPGRLDRLDAIVQDVRPDIVVNFFEPLAGLYYGLRDPSPPMVSIAHQYMFLHPEYQFPGGWPVSRRAVQGFARLTAWGAARCIALSLYPAADDPARRITVHPPLLRAAVRHAAPCTEPFLLLYLLNRGYLNDVRQWHAQHPALRLHVFVQRPDAPSRERVDDTLTLHQLDGARFVSMMARCRGFVSTAGFESVAEARYLGKPVQVVPVAGHFEQRCNAHDVVRAGAGCWTPRFTLDPMRMLTADPPDPDASFRRWVDRGQGRMVRVIEEVVGRSPVRRGAGVDAPVAL
jgi:uncharacterized protein (TIGR00661 family)